MNKSRFTAKSMSYEHSYEQYSLVYKSRRGEEIDGIYKYYICHYNFSPHYNFCHGNFWGLIALDAIQEGLFSFMAGDGKTTVPGLSHHKTRP